MKKKVLFLCTHNSARSQMAEAIINSKKTNLVAYSAGISPAKEVHPLAIKAMAKLNIDISGQKPKSADQFLKENFDFVISLCSNDKEKCLQFPGMPIYDYWQLPDPKHFSGTANEQLSYFEEITSELDNRIKLFIAVAG